jgi:hypothetical protein
VAEHADLRWSPDDSLWRRRAEQLAEQLEVLRMAHATLVRSHRDLRARAAALSPAPAPPRYVVRAAHEGVVYSGPSRTAALTAAKNAYWARPFSFVVVLDGEDVVWSSRAS